VATNMCTFTHAGDLRPPRFLEIDLSPVPIGTGLFRARFTYFAPRRRTDSPDTLRPSCGWSPIDAWGAEAISLRSGSPATGAHT
jgi:hypothetical protein